MAVINVNGFLFHDGLDSDCIVVESERLVKYVEYINWNNIKKISINGHYYRLRDIEFIKECPNIEDVSIYTDNVLDFSPLYILKKLIKLHFNSSEGKLDFSIFKELNYLSMFWNKKMAGLAECKNLNIYG